MPPARSLALVVEEEAADVDERIGPSGGGCGGGVGAIDGGQAQRGGHGGPSLGIEAAVEDVAVIEGLRQVQRSLGLGRLGRLGSGPGRPRRHGRQQPATLSGAR